ncbi:MAG: hypothetical protein N2512_15765 [Armatimonadetes bacterium]|nr:hypothetical protein [Armatimonadota bacterium]
MAVLRNEADQLEVAERLRKKLREARRSRYPVLLVLADLEDTCAQFWQVFAGVEGLAYVDMLDESQDEELRGASYNWPDLVQWIRDRATKGGGAVVTQVDAFATRWPPRDRERLFRKLLKSDLRDESKNATPLVVVSSLAGECDLPVEHRPTDYGLVEDLRE